MSSTATLAPNPAAIFDLLLSYEKSYALKGAIDLDLFTAIGEGAHTVPDLAKRCSASQRGIRILCDYLTVSGLLTKTGNEYELTPDASMFLNRKSPAFLGGATGFLLHPDMTRAFADIAETVRRGTTTLSGAGNVSDNNKIWIEFANDMAAMMTPAAMEIAAKAV